MLHIAYRISSLAELQELIDDVLANTRAAAGRKVDASEIVVQTPGWKFVEATLASETLSDNSEVFNLEFSGGAA